MGKMLPAGLNRFIENRKILSLTNSDQIREVKFFINGCIFEILEECGFAPRILQVHIFINKNLKTSKSEAAQYLKTLFKQIPGFKKHFISDIHAVCGLYNLENWNNPGNRRWVLSRFVKDISLHTKKWAPLIKYNGLPRRGAASLGFTLRQAQNFTQRRMRTLATPKTRIKRTKTMRRARWVKVIGQQTRIFVFRLKNFKR